jgi:pimeloyl-ACP methyl ester carboxylesterase
MHAKHFAATMLAVFTFWFSLFGQLTEGTEYTTRTNIPNLTTQTLNLFIPDGVTFIRAVIGASMHEGGANIYRDRASSSDPQAHADGTLGYRALAKKLNCAVLGYNLRAVEPDAGNPDNATTGRKEAWDAIVAALETFAGSTGHPELRYAPVTTCGLSRGGMQAAYLSSYQPSRLICFISIHPAIFNSNPQSGAIQVPGAFAMGENDGLVRDRFVPYVKAGRSRNAPWFLYISPNTGHAAIIQQDLNLLWLELMISQRLPATISGDVPVQLNAVSLENGYLGTLEYNSSRSPTTIEYASYSSYQGNPSSAYWLPNESFAQNWESYMLGQAVEIRSSRFIRSTGARAVALPQSAILFSANGRTLQSSRPAGIRISRVHKEVHLYMPQ